jgi:uncharacterized Zn-binding protein involved in type VI secretion
MPAAARLGDQTSHPGVVVGPGVETVTIGGIPAAVMGDTHACSFPGTPEHPSTPIMLGSTTVTIGGRPAARVGDSAGCGATILVGKETVVIGG